MDAVAKIVPAQIVYLEIPAASLRHFCDSTFASFAKCSIADIASGMGHRYKAGHDLLIDVFSTFKEKGIGEAIHQAGHIALTDFPTKAGIPIPGFSQSGLGGFLQEYGIGAGWMQVNIMDVGVGIIAVSESHPELCAALDGALEMNTATFFDTFVEGAVELAFAYGTKNPILLIGGLENILSGIAATCTTIYDTISVYVDPIDFFGAACSSALVGYFLTMFLKKDSGHRKYLNMIRSGGVGCAFAITPAFGWGALAAMISMELGQKLYEYNKPEYYSINLKTAERLLNTLCIPSVDVEMGSHEELLFDGLIELSNPAVEISDSLMSLPMDSVELEVSNPEVGISAPMISLPMDSVEFVSEQNPILFQSPTQET